VNNENRNIPSSIKRIVRQKCGFGCIFCGIPLYEYDHIEDWAVVGVHKAENITLLCDRHHREKTSGLLTKEQVIEANKSPYNVINKTSTPYDLHFEGSNFEISIANGSYTLFINNLNPRFDFIIPFIIDNVALIGFVIIENQLFFNLTVQDEDGKKLLEIVENELNFSTDLWDIEFVGKNLKLRQAKRNIVFDIDFFIPNKINLNRGIFNFNGRQITVNGNEIRYNKNVIRAWNSYFINYRILFAIGEYNNLTPCLFQYK